MEIYTERFGKKLPYIYDSNSVSSSLKPCPVFERRLQLFFFKNLFYQNQCKYAMSTGIAQITGALLLIFNPGAI